jgi:hypothetical protein
MTSSCRRAAEQRDELATSSKALSASLTTSRAWSSAVSISLRVSKQDENQRQCPQQSWIHLSAAVVAYARLHF